MGTSAGELYSCTMPTLRGWKATAETELRWPLKLFLRANRSTVGGWNARSRKGFSTCSATRRVPSGGLAATSGRVRPRLSRDVARENAYSSGNTTLKLYRYIEVPM